MKMTTEQIEALVQAVTPHLQTSLRDILTKEYPAHAFDVDGTTDGVRTPNSHSIVMLLLEKPLADGFLNTFAAAYAASTAPRQTRSSNATDDRTELSKP